LISALAAVAFCHGAPAQAQQAQWDQLPRMVLEAQFAGPLQDTIIQRWRDPGTATVCYLYLPITVQHSPPVPGNYVKYGPNTIGSMSCTALANAPVHQASQKPASQKPAPAAATSAQAAPARAPVPSAAAPRPNPAVPAASQRPSP
jgi:hypothetical protein